MQLGGTEFLLKTMKIGIVGTGIAGLTSGWLFGAAGHKVTVFDRGGIGLDRHSQQGGRNSDFPQIDLPLRFINRTQWPTMMRLYELLNVDLIEVESSQSFSLINGKVFLKVEPGGLFRQNPLALLNPTVNRIHREISRLSRTGASDLTSGIADEITFAEYLASRNFSGDFLGRFLYPLLCTTVCTCSKTALDNYPARIVLETLVRIAGSTGEQPHALFKARQGTSDVAAKLLQFKPAVISDAAVQSITDLGTEVEIRFRQVDSQDGLQSERFDHVILATQANHAGRLLQTNGKAEPVNSSTVEMLQCFEYERVEVVLHTDRKLMPADRRSWSAFNMISGQPSGHSVQNDRSTGSMCSIWIHRLDPSFQSEQDVFQTIKPIVQPEPATIIASCQLQRPVVNQNSFRGWDLWNRFNRQPDRRIWFVGSYACPGVPLLETAAVSSIKVALAMGIATPLDCPALSAAWDWTR